MGGYTVWALWAPVLVGLLEVTVLRTGVLRQGRFWAAIAITLGFQVLVDGWLTKLSAPIVRYQAADSSGVRWPWDIPVEDYGFGLAMVGLTLMIWVRLLGAGGAR
jgi:lycopene cyclase domain-containing protein